MDSETRELIDFYWSTPRQWDSLRVEQREDFLSGEDVVGDFIAAHGRKPILQILRSQDL